MEQKPKITGKFIITSMIIGHMDKALEIKTRIAAGETNDDVLISLGIIKNNDLLVIVVAEDELGNIIFQDLKEYKKEQQQLYN